MAQPTLEQLCARAALEAPARLLIIAHAALCRPDLELLAPAARLAHARGASGAVLREVCLQGIAYAGFPRALAALEVVAACVPAASGEPQEPTSDVAARGAAHFGRVYGRQADRLRAKIAGWDPAFAALTVDVAYGRILSRPGIDGRTRELMGVAALSVLDQPPQMIAHAYGARNFGAGDAEIFEAQATVALLWDDVAAREHADLLRSELVRR